MSFAQYLLKQTTLHCCQCCSMSLDWRRIWLKKQDRSVSVPTCRNMVKNDTPPITANIREKNVALSLTTSRSGFVNTWKKRKNVKLTSANISQIIKITRNIHDTWIVRVTHSDDLGEDDGEQRLHNSVDYGTDESQQNVRPLSKIETKHFEEGHGGNIFILQRESEKQLSQTHKTGLLKYCNKFTDTKLSLLFCCYYLFTLDTVSTSTLAWMIKRCHILQTTGKPHCITGRLCNKFHLHTISVAEAVTICFRCVAVLIWNTKYYNQCIKKRLYEHPTVPSQSVSSVKSKTKFVSHPFLKIFREGFC